MDEHIDLSTNALQRSLDANVSALTTSIGNEAHEREVQDASILNYINGIKNTIDEHIDVSVNAINRSIANNVADLASAINTETEERQAVDNAIISQLNEQVSQIESRIDDSVSSIASNQSVTDSSIALLNELINEEIITREANDNNIINQIIDNTSAIEQHIDASIDAINTVIADNEDAIATAIMNEREERINADSTIVTYIDSTKTAIDSHIDSSVAELIQSDSAINSNISELADNLEEEAQIRQTMDASIISYANDIKADIEDHIDSSVAVLNSTISSNKNELTTAINAEKTERQAFDSSITSYITDTKIDINEHLDSSYIEIIQKEEVIISDMNALAEDLNAEITARQNADTSITTDMSNLRSEINEHLDSSYIEIIQNEDVIVSDLNALADELDEETEKRQIEDTSIISYVIDTKDEIIEHIDSSFVQIIQNENAIISDLNTLSDNIATEAQTRETMDASIISYVIDVKESTESHIESSVAEIESNIDDINANISDLTDTIAANATSD